MFGLLFLVFLFCLIALIVGLIKPSKLNRIPKGDWTRGKVLKVFGLLTVVFFILTAISAPNSPKPDLQKEEVKKENESIQQIVKTDQKPNPTSPVSPIPTKTPETKSAKEILEEASKTVAKDSIALIDEENGGWVIVKQVEMKDDFGMFSSAKETARDFIFAIYATKLPINHVAITINHYSSGKYYRAGLGKDMAATQSESTWTNKNVGPTIFYDFLKKATNGKSGDGKYSTYVETNLN